MPNGQDLALFLPEIILLVAGITVMLADLFLREKASAETSLAWVSLAGLGLALVASVAFFGQSAMLFRLAADPAAPGSFVADNFTGFFRIIAILTTMIVILASVDYMRGKVAYRGEFFALMFFSTLAMTLMAGSTDLIMVIIALEFLSITSYVLTGYLRGNLKSNEGAVKYFLYGSITTAVTFYGASLLYGVAGTTNLYELAAAFGDPATVQSAGVGSLMLVAMVFLLAGFGFKIALVPFHQWSPDAYEGAPTPVTAFLSVGPKAAGLAMLLRVFVVGLPAFEPDWAAILVGLAMVTMTVGNLIALQQGNIKRLMAYSSIAQAGYMLIGVAAISLGSIAGAPTGAAGAGLPLDGTAGVLLYILAYLFTNLGLFIGIIAVDYLGGSETLPGYAGLIRRSPFLTAAMTVFFLSLVGIPPTAGFIGKFWVFGAAIQQQLYLLAAVGAVNGVVSVVYYFKVIKQMWYEAPVDASPLNLTGSMRLALVLCLVFTLAMGLYPSPFIDLANQSIQMLGVVVAGGG